MNPHSALQYLLCWEHKVSRSISVACLSGYRLLIVFGVCRDKPGPGLHRKPITDLRQQCVKWIHLEMHHAKDRIHDVSEVPEVECQQHHRLSWIRKVVLPCSRAKAKRIKNPGIKASIMHKDKHSF